MSRAEGQAQVAKAQCESEEQLAVVRGQEEYETVVSAASIKMQASKVFV